MRLDLAALVWKPRIFVFRPKIKANALDHLNPDYVHILVDGKIIESGGFELVEKLDSQGYEGWL